MGAPTFFYLLFIFKLIATYIFRVIHVREDNVSNVYAVVTRIIWITWIQMSIVRERPLNITTHSLTPLTNMN